MGDEKEMEGYFNPPRKFSTMTTSNSELHLKLAARLEKNQINGEQSWESTPIVSVADESAGRTLRQGSADSSDDEAEALPKERLSDNISPPESLRPQPQVRATSFFSMPHAVTKYFSLSPTNCEDSAAASFDGGNTRSLPNEVVPLRKSDRLYS